MRHCPADGFIYRMCLFRLMPSSVRGLLPRRQTAHALYTTWASLHTQQNWPNSKQRQTVSSPIPRHKRTRMWHNSHLSIPLAVLRHLTAISQQILHLYPAASHKFGYSATYAEPGKSFTSCPNVLLCAIHFFPHAHTTGL